MKKSLASSHDGSKPDFSRNVASSYLKPTACPKKDFFSRRSLGDFPEAAYLSPVFRDDVS
ncbi:MAG: hypothetical protein CBC33_002275 [Coraliomargarita sp. TMED73]|nr:MAG: hypothetical protein CBC33_002275 [Coraliomargarita sp. TMED73]